MITYPAYSLLHLVGAFLLFFGFGVSLMQSRLDEAGQQAARRWAGILHGLGLAVLLVAGFGLLARLGIHWPWPGWVWGKVIVWLALGGVIVAYKRSLGPVYARIIAVLALGALAAWLAVYKPF